MSNTFLSEAEVSAIGFAETGSPVYISRLAVFHRPEMIRLGSHVRIDDFCLLSGGSGISIGNVVHISAYSALYGGSGIEMADFSNIAARAVLFSEMDDTDGTSLMGPMIPPEYKPGYRRGKVIMERHSGLGAGSVAFEGVVIGEGTVVGALSVVKGPCEPWSIYGGVPAKKIKGRKRDLLRLEEACLKTLLG